jgi:hypothetical protein
MSRAKIELCTLILLKVKIFESQIILISLGARKPKGRNNRIDKIG